VGGGLDGVHKCTPRFFAHQTPKVLGRNHHHFISPVHGDVLRPFAAHAANQLAEPRFRVLQDPVAGKGCFVWPSGNTV
jgi:hypothetical protein